MENLHVSESSSVHHQEIFTVHTAMVYVIQVPSRSRLQAVSKPVWHIPLLYAQWKTPDDGQRNCPVHVKFPFQNKFWEISAFSWFIIRKSVTMHGHLHVKLFCDCRFQVPELCKSRNCLFYVSLSLSLSLCRLVPFLDLREFPLLSALLIWQMTFIIPMRSIQLHIQITALVFSVEKISSNIADNLPH